MHLSRRDFLGRAGAMSVFGMGALRAQSQVKPADAFGKLEPDRVLVVVQLSGGNDGLNTVIPYEDDRYHQARPGLRIAKEDVLPLSAEVGLHPAMRPCLELFDAERLAVYQGVGYPNPNRSHFRSMEIWHTASDAGEHRNRGWLGRYLDLHAPGSAPAHLGLALMEDRPQAFDGREGLGLATTMPGRFGWDPGRNGASTENLLALHEPPPPPADTLGFLRRTATNALLSAREIREAAERGEVAQLNARGADSLKLVAGLIRGGLATQVYYVSLGSFDTHAGQGGRHANLLGQLAGALAEFQQRLEKDGTSRRVLTLVFSEFGRRVAENGSQGTDHGTAGPLFLMGEPVRCGLRGQHPDLGDLDRGDLKFTMDFRSIYASIIGDWLEGDADRIIRKGVQRVPVLART